MYHLRQNESVLGKPFFHVVSTGEMEKADTFSRRLRELGVRAGYLRPSTIHDFRAEGLYLVGRVPPSPPLTRLLELTWVADKLYSAAQRMMHGGHRDERTYCDSYMPNNAGTDLQGGYFDGKLRSIVNDRFRGLTLHRNPELWQALPARKQHELEDTPEGVKRINELFLAKPFVLQKLLGGGSIPWIELHDLADKGSVSFGKLLVC